MQEQSFSKHDMLLRMFTHPLNARVACDIFDLKFAASPKNSNTSLPPTTHSIILSPPRPTPPNDLCSLRRRPPVSSFLEAIFFPFVEQILHEKIAQSVIQVHPRETHLGTKSWHYMYARFEPQKDSSLSMAQHVVKQT